MNTILVTGGGGFVGSALVARLCEQGHRVTALARHYYPELERHGARSLIGDITDLDCVRRSCRDVETVFHVAAKAGIWGRRQEYEQTNVHGTVNVIQACRENGVARLVYTSTPSVVFDRADITGGDETLPYSDNFLCHYARSKARAEHQVLAANSERLKTCAIRPHLIWGPGDPHLIPRLVDRGRRRELSIVGDGTNQVDISYIDNVVHAHLLAWQCLEKSDKCGGQAYFIGQEHPVKLWQWINELFAELQIPPVRRRVARPLAYCAGALLETVYRSLNLRGEPKMTRFLAEQLSRSHYFSHAKALRDIGYQPIVSLAEGQQRLLTWIRSI
ncbi:MAG: NAD-dependent epimerase/dehydratase family protein [Desulfobulbaceae bacterium]|nr:NAD-dependent epimerase/dehydratase family protein [Desulfobulbaceae bacterium]